MVPTIRAGGRRLRVATSRGRRLTVPSRWGLSVAACWRWATGIVATRRRLALRKNTSYACTVQNRPCTCTHVLVLLPGHVNGTDPLAVAEVVTREVIKGIYTNEKLPASPLSMAVL